LIELQTYNNAIVYIKKNNGEISSSAVRPLASVRSLSLTLSSRQQQFQQPALPSSSKAATSS